MLTAEILREKAKASPNFDLPATHPQVVLVNIIMDKQLKSFPWYARRRMKLKILSDIFEQTFKSSNDLMLGQASAIIEADQYQAKDFGVIIKNSLREFFDDRST